VATERLYANPQEIANLDDCYFYHTMNIPGYGRVEGDCELQPRRYLGGVDFRSKRVLDLGTADGFLSFYMERQGAEAIACELPPNAPLDIVPMSRFDHEAFHHDARMLIPRLHNAFWLCHKAHKSQAKLVHSSAYDLPPEIGTVDISVFGSILLHLRDPFLALQSALKLTRETVIVADVAPWYTMPKIGHLPLKLMKTLDHSPTMLNLVNSIIARASWFRYPYVRFVPVYWVDGPMYTWWEFTPMAIKQFIAVLGFEKAEVTYHLQKYKGAGREKMLLFTVVGHRTQRRDFVG
jgi:hypothetical protein